jgi:hypothetical protein
MKFFNYIINRYRQWQEKRTYKKKLAEMRKKEPFIYK